MEEKEKSTVVRVPRDGKAIRKVPEGFREMTPDEREKWKDAKSAFEIAQARLDAATHALNAAKLAIEKANEVHNATFGVILSVEKTLGVEKGDDIVFTKEGLVCVRVKAKPEEKPEEKKVDSRIPDIPEAGPDV